MADDMEQVKPEALEVRYDFFCEFCWEERINEKAVGYCLDCKEYLCELCFNGHKRNRHNRHHDLLDSEHMPKDKPLSYDRLITDISKKCLKHKGAVVEYYCVVHGEFSCNTCVIDDHIECRPENILEKSMTITESPEYRGFHKRLTEVTERYNKSIGSLHMSMSTSESRYSITIASIRQYRDELKTIIDIRAEDFETRIATIRSKEKEELDSILKSLMGQHEDIKLLSSDFQKLETNKRVCEMYIALKEGDNDLSQFDCKRESLDKKNTIRDYIFQPSQQMRVVLENSDSFGSITINDQSSCSLGSIGNFDMCDIQEVETKSTNSSTEEILLSYKLVRNVKDVNVLQLTDIEVGSTDEIYTCRITGSAVISDDKLVVVDSKNCNIKLIDTNLNKVISKVSVPQYPTDVTRLEVDQIAVSVGKLYQNNENKIIVLSVNNNIKIMREITIDNVCRGLSFRNNLLVVSVFRRISQDVATWYSIEIMNTHGHVFKDVIKPQHGKSLLEWPEFMCLSDDSNIIYVSDYRANRVIGLNKDGEVMAVYTDENLKGPQNVCIGPSGCVFVCAYTSKNVHMLTYDCKKVRVIPTEKGGLTDSVYSVSFSKETNKLYVGMRNNNIRVYQLSAS